MRARILKLTFRTRIHVPTLASPTYSFRKLSLQYMLQPFIPGDVCRSDGGTTDKPPVIHLPGYLKLGGAPPLCISPIQLTMTSTLDRFFTCDFTDCVLPSVRGFGPCERCNRHLCATHRRPPSHTCDDTVYIPCSCSLLELHLTTISPSQMMFLKPINLLK